MKLKTILENSGDELNKKFLELYPKTTTLGIGNNVLIVSKVDDGNPIHLHVGLILNDFPTNGTIITDMVKGLHEDMSKKGVSEVNPEIYVKYVTINIDNKSSINLLSLLPPFEVGKISHGGPNMSEILLGMEDFDFDFDVLPKVDDKLSEWIDIVIKRCNTAYEVLKKGKINVGPDMVVEYELELANINTTIQWKGGKQPITKNDIIPTLQLYFKTTDKLSEGQRETIIDIVTKKFQKMFNISPLIY